MGELNPYEAPRAEVSVSVSPQIAWDRKMAQRMLEARAKGGYSFALYYRWSALRLLLLVVYFGVLMAIVAAFGMWYVFAVLLGILLGVLLQTQAYARGIKKAWPLTVRITDWEQVHKIAEGEPL